MHVFEQLHAHDFAVNGFGNALVGIANANLFQGHDLARVKFAGLKDFPKRALPQLAQNLIGGWMNYRCKWRCSHGLRMGTWKWRWPGHERVVLRPAESQTMLQ